MSLDPNRPHDYPRRALVCMVGLSPAVVTETLYALVKQQEPAFVPTELHVITTTRGAEGVHRHLLADGEGHFHRLLAEHLPGHAVSFDPQRNVHLVCDGDTPLPDIVEPAHQCLMADTILRVLRELAADPQCAIHASIAGGRKSMSFYMGYGMSLLARAQDRMSHVLVMPEDFEHPEFFYPPLVPRELTTRDKRTVNTRDARLALAPVSFVRLADGGADWLRQTRSSFDEAVAFAQLALTPQPVTLHLESGTVESGGCSARLEPVEMAWYSYLARRRQADVQDEALPFAGAVKLRRAFEDCAGLDLAAVCKAFADCGCRGMPKYDETHSRQSDLDLASEVREVVSHINRKLAAAFGPQAAQRLMIAGPGERRKRDGVYGLMNLAPELITINARIAADAR